MAQRTANLISPIATKLFSLNSFSSKLLSEKARSASPTNASDCSRSRTNSREKHGPHRHDHPMVHAIADQLKARDRNLRMLQTQAGAGEGHSCVIDPRTNGWLGYWDLTVCVALIFTACFTPVEVGFMRVPDDKWRDPLFLINRCVDFIFIVDMGFQFLLMYPEQERGDGVVGSSVQHWVSNQRQIARHYILSFWFYLDFFSIAVSGLDVFIGGEVEGIGSLRALRVLRMLKLVRLARGSRVWKRWEMRLSINYAMLSILNICVTLFFVCHLFACVWGLQASFDPLGTWLGAKEYCVPYTADDLLLFRGGFNASEACPEGYVCNGPEGYACVGADLQYLYSLYWSIATVTSIGYGDVSATPLNGIEQLMCVCMMLLGSLLFAYLVGSFCGLAANLSPDTVRFRQDLTDLNKFLTANAIPTSLRYELREYMHQAVALRRAATGNRLLGGLAPKLRNEVALTINEKWLEKIDLINDDVEQGLVLELAFALTLQIFPPGDGCPIGSIYIVSRGAALFAGRVYTSGRSWGEAEALLLSERLRFPIPASAITYLFTYSIDGDTLRWLMSQSKYPEASARLRRKTVQWILRRGMVRAAEEKIALRTQFPRKGSRRGSSFVPEHLGKSSVVKLIGAAANQRAADGRVNNRSNSRERKLLRTNSSESVVRRGKEARGGSDAVPRRDRKARSSKEAAEELARSPTQVGQPGASPALAGLSGDSRLPSVGFTPPSFSLDAVPLASKFADMGKPRARHPSSEPTADADRADDELAALKVEVRRLAEAQHEDSRAIRQMLGMLMSSTLGGKRTSFQYAFPAGAEEEPLADGRGAVTQTPSAGSTSSNRLTA